jgi:hypothetical protein
MMGTGFVINIEPSSLAGTLIARRDAQAFTPNNRLFYIAPLKDPLFYA